ncbi:MAG TPA: antibiotic biosynthesis monooxygenase family protein [Candidatus Binatia bacterium]|nr:antibiotic biosynthesis monooxygenase family protein [Candidatus Binatia bacterium]
MAVKIVIQRKVKPGREKELNNAVRELRSKAIHAQGYISGETLCSIEDPSVHLVMSTWRSLEDWNRWADSPERKAFQQKIDAMLEEPTKITSYQYESVSPEVAEILTGLEFSVQDE